MAAPGAAGQADHMVQVILVSPAPSLLGALLERMIGRSPDCSAHHFPGLGEHGGDLADTPADVVLVQVTDSDEGFAIARACRQRWPGAPILLLVPDVHPRCSRMAAEVGAAGWLTCHTGEEELLSAIRVVARTGRLRRTAAGTTTLSRHRTGDGLLLDLLSGRERQVLQLLAAAHSLDQIAKQLGISPNTVRTHVQNVITKLGVNSRLEAVLLAQRAGAVNARQLLDLRESGSRDREAARHAPARPRVGGAR